MSTLMRRLAWTGQVIAIYLLAEFAIFTISTKAMRALFHGPAEPAWWVTLLFYFLPLTVSAWWMLGVLFGPRPPMERE